MSEEELSDDFLDNCIGAWGCWQFCMVTAIYLAMFPIAFHQLNIIFLIYPVKISCKNNSPLCSEECDEYVYDRTILEETLITQFNLFCDKKFLAPVAQVVAMVGIFTGNVIMGVLSDKYGRKWPLISAIIISVVTGVASAFSPWYWLFCIFRFLCSVATGGIMNTSFVMLMEIAGKKYRTVIGIIYQVPFSLGYALLGLVAYLQRHWKWFLFYLSVTPSVLVTYCIILPEAPRWSFAMGKKEKVIRTLEKAAKCNKRPVDKVRPYIEEAFKTSPENDRRHAGNLTLLFQYRFLRKRTACIASNWFVCGFCFYGISQYINQLAGNIFLNVAVAGLIQIPGIIVAVYLLEQFGRKKSLIASNITASIATFVLAFIPKHLAWIEVALASVAVTALTICFANVYVYSGELFPTALRSSAIGFCSMIARFGAIIAPFVPSLSDYSSWLPSLVFAIVPIIGSVLCLFLPETKGLQLPNTIEEAQLVDS